MKPTPTISLLSSLLSLLLPLLLATAVHPTAARGQEHTDVYNVRDFGAKGDGQTDDTAAFQRALDAAGKAGGGTVKVPRGIYFFAGHLKVPSAVTLAGMWQSPAPEKLTRTGRPTFAR